MIRPDLAYRFPNTGTRWTSVEVALLKSLANAGTDWREVGLTFGRTSEACRMKAVDEGIIIAEARPSRPARKRQGAACVLS